MRRYRDARPTPRAPPIMDLLTAERLNGRLWNCVKYGALLCFLIAGTLLAASLFIWPSDQIGSAQSAPERGPPSGYIGPTR